MALTRRHLLSGFAAMIAGGAGLGAYALGVEPIWRLGVTRYRLRPPGWPANLRLRLAVLADIHACDPWMTEMRVRQIVARTNALAADAVLLLGDYVASYRMRRFSRHLEDARWAGALAGLAAPLGVHAVLGNHDWWDDLAAQRSGKGPIAARRALEGAGIPVYENDAVRLQKNGAPFWIAGLGDQWAFFIARRRSSRKERFGFTGVDDLDGALARVTDDAPVILLAHEPDIFPHVPDRVALTLSGHTHGGQVRVFGYAPVVPSFYGQRYAYGHIVEEGRHLIVSGGLGCSGLPIRFGSPPEIVLIELGDAPA